MIDDLSIASDCSSTVSIHDRVAYLNLKLEVMQDLLCEQTTEWKFSLAKSELVKLKDRLVQVELEKEELVQQVQSKTSKLEQVKLGKEDLLQQVQAKMIKLERKLSSWNGLSMRAKNLCSKCNQKRSSWNWSSMRTKNSQASIVKHNHAGKGQA
jgi:hypothetical protein